MNEFTLPPLNPSLRKKVEEALIETTDEEDKLSLIVGVQVESATAADNSFVEDAIKKAEEVTGNKVTTLYSGGAYQSPSNRKFAETEQIKFVAMAFRESGQDLILQTSCRSIKSLMETQES